MHSFFARSSFLQGHLKVPSSKSQTLRAIYFAFLARGTSYIHDFLPSPDTTAMIQAVRELGAQVEVLGNCLEIRGCAGKPMAASNIIDCGNSGLVLRFIGALAGLIPYYTILTGDASIRQNRPAASLLHGLKQLGAFAVSSKDNGFAPLVIKGPFSAASAVLDGKDSQPVSGLVMAAAFAPYSIELHVQNPGEKPWVDLTLYWLDKLGIPYERHEYSYYRLYGNAQIEGFTYRVPGDFSTAAFPMIAAILTQSEVTLHNMDMKDPQGDKAIIPLLQSMGALIHIDEEKNTLTVKSCKKLKGKVIDVNDSIDALPILSVLACFAEGRTEIVNASMARCKESDRIHCITKELQKMGALIEEKPDGLVIDPSPLYGAKLYAHHDHRMALALTVAALGAKNESEITGAECIAKTYPTFYEDFRSLGANLSD
jgi:3-phosphoshikimate 1-carboxyvinyltransferase